MNPHFTIEQNNLYNHLIQTRNIINNFLINNYSDSFFNNYTPNLNSNYIPLNTTNPRSTLRSVRNSMDNLINTLNTPLRFTRQTYNFPRYRNTPYPPRTNNTSNINIGNNLNQTQNTNSTSGLNPNRNIQIPIPNRNNINQTIPNLTPEIILNSIRETEDFFNLGNLNYDTRNQNEPNQNAINQNEPNQNEPNQNETNQNTPNQNETPNNNEEERQNNETINYESEK